MEPNDKFRSLEKQRSATQADERDLLALRVQVTRLMSPRASAHGVLHPFFYLNVDELRQAKEAWTKQEYGKVRELCELARRRYPKGTETIPVF